MRSAESPSRSKDPTILPKIVGAQISSSTQTSPDSSKESMVAKDTGVIPESIEEIGTLNGLGEEIPKSPSSVSPSKLSHRSSRKSERNRTHSPKGASSKRRGAYDEKVPVKEAMSPSVAESIRSGKRPFINRQSSVK